MDMAPGIIAHLRWVQAKRPLTRDEAREIFKTAKARNPAELRLIQSVVGRLNQGEFDHELGRVAGSATFG